VGEQAVLEGIMTGIFGILGSSITEWYQDVAPI
jgi:hypothetical protein